MRRRAGVLLALLLLLLPGCALDRLACAPRVSTVGTGLTNPRGLARGPDGTLYVAEAGVAATGGRVSRIDASGRAAPIVTGLPHSVNAGIEDVGASGLAWRGPDLWVAIGEGSGALGSSLTLLSGGRGAPVGVVDLARFELARNPDDAEVESNPFALLYDSARDRFLVTDAAGNALLAVTPDGAVSVVAVWRDGVVPTGIALGPDGAIYVALLGRFPHPPRNGRIDRVEPDGRITPIGRDMTLPIGVALAGDGALYALEFAGGMRTAPRLEFEPRSGRLLRLDGRVWSVVTDRLPYPTGLLLEPDGSVLISTMGAMGSSGSGSVIRVTACRRRS